MKRLLATTAITLALITGANAAPLSAGEKGYITLAVGAAMVFSKCPDYQAVPGSFLKVQDKLGVAKDIPVAVLAAVKALSDATDYDRDELIPEVTTEVRLALEMIAKDTKSQKFCSTYGKIMTEGGLIKKGSKL